MNDPLEILISQWTRLGAGFNARPSRETPDLERLLLDTARFAPRMARLYIMAATWLDRHAECVARHRLARLIRQELAPESRPVLAMLLEESQRSAHPARFRSITAALAPADPPRPLFEIEAANPVLVARAQRRASELSRKWGLWSAPIEFKLDALRPARWIFAHNPGLIPRADFRGDLRASVLAALQHDPGAGDSELALARAAGGSRAQVRKALDDLELTGRVRRHHAPRPRPTRITLADDRLTGMPAA
jgi:hypothetical protein